MTNIERRVTNIIVDKLGVDYSEVTPDARFGNDLNADSLDVVELTLAFEEEFGIEIPESDAEQISTVGEAMRYIENVSKCSVKEPLPLTQISCYDRRLVFVGSESKCNSSVKTVPYVCFNSIPSTFIFREKQRNTLYTLHPLSTNLYIPFEGSDVVLLKEKTREFMKFMSYLGAKKVKAYAHVYHFNASNTSSSYNASLGGSYKFSSGSGSYSSTSSLYEREEKSNDLNFEAVFEGRKNPALIDSLEWYKIEPSWQKIREVIECGTKSYKESFSTSSMRAVSSSNRESIKADLKILLANVSGSYEETINRMVETKDDLIETIEVEF